MSPSSPSNEQVRLRCVTRRRELASLLAEILFLEEAEGPDLNARYLRRFGWKQYEGLLLRWQLERTRRTMEVIRDMRSSGEHLYLPAIEYRVDRSMAEWNRRLHRHREDLRDAEAASLFERRARRTGDVHAALIDALEHLHPKLRLYEDDDRVRLWDQLLEAYDRGDVNEILTLRTVSCEMLGDSLKDCTEAQFSELLEHFRAVEADARARVESLKHAPPFTYRDILADEAAAQRLLKRMEEETRELEAERDAAEHALKRLLADHAHE